MHYMMFLPGGLGTAQQALAELGLEEFHRGANHVAMSPESSPIGEAGVMICWPTPQGPPNQMLASDKLQDWIPEEVIASAPRYYVGIWKDSPIEPNNLIKPFPQPGALVEMGDGQQWTIPLESQLDSTRVLSNGEWTWQIRSEFQQYAFEIQRMRYKVATDLDSLNFHDVADLVTKGLQINYRLLPEVVAHCGLITKKTVMDALGRLMEVSANDQ